jgi:hypothetical protein
MGVKITRQIIVNWIAVIYAHKAILSTVGPVISKLSIDCISVVFSIKHLLLGMVISQRHQLVSALNI